MERIETDDIYYLLLLISASYIIIDDIKYSKIDIFQDNHVGDKDKDDNKYNYFLNSRIVSGNRYGHCDNNILGRKRDRREEGKIRNTPPTSPPTPFL